MFAIFLSEKMTPFYDICISFPTIIFTVLLVFVLLYWMVAVLGLVDLDVLDIDFGDASGDGGSSLDAMAGLLFKLGLNGVPLTVVISIVTLIAWPSSFLTTYFLYPFVPGDILQFLLGIPVLLAILYFSCIITAKLIAPLRPILKTANQEVQKELIGQVAVVRTGRVDQQFGEATLDDGGAGLIIKVRSFDEKEFKRGDRVVLIEYDSLNCTYKIILESEFTRS